MNHTSAVKCRNRFRLREGLGIRTWEREKTLLASPKGLSTSLCDFLPISGETSDVTRYVTVYNDVRTRKFRSCTKIRT